MPDNINPQQASKETTRRGLKYAFLQSGRVTRAPDTTADGQHHVKVQESAAPVDQPIPVIPQVHGDYYIPPEGAPVITAARGENQYNVIGAAIPQVETPTISAGERIVSHPLSDAHVMFNADGSLDVVGDAEVRINGGTQGIITDINTTTADGYVTSVTPVRDSNIKI